jgi:putative FmdB family regulatory protein
VPLYEYRCHKCDVTFEVRQKFADEPVTEHEGCGGEVERLISAPSFQFKGSGWYVNDYGKGGKLPAGDGSKEGGAKDGGSKDGSKDAKSKDTSSDKADSGGKSDSKPEAPKKTESKPESKPSTVKTSTE